jgi:hypothetical protein
MGGNSTTTNTTQSSIQQQQLPPWVNEAAEQNYAFAQNVANRPLQQYQGQMVADVGPQMQQAWNLAANSGNAGGPQYQEAEAGLLSSLGKAAPQIATTNLQNYMNPYTQNVINTTLPLMQQQAAQQQANLGANATQASAFGGSRQGVAQGVAGAQSALNMGQMAAQLNQANYQQAQQAATSDVNAQLQKNQQDLLASQGLTNLGQQAQTNQARQFSELTTAGALEQSQAQNQINAQQNKFNQAWNYPNQQMSTLLSALGMTPYGQTNVGVQTGQQTTDYSNNLGMAALGGLQTLGGLFSGGSNSAMSGIMGLLGMSDRRLKTDIQKVDTHPSGLPIYSYRYKGDPKTYPKVVGPMAEDVQKIAPQAVKPLGVGGRLGVDMGTLNAATVPRGTLPGALSPSVPIGATGALGATLKPPRLRRRQPAMPGRGALSGA